MRTNSKSKIMKKIYFSWMLLVIVAMSCSNSQTASNKQDENKNVAKEKTVQAVGKELAPGVIMLPNNQVCMVNDAFKPAEQIPVTVNGKTYYGCCQGCVDALKTNELARTTTDLISGESIDKATSVAILKPGSKEQVLYFANEANAIKYVKGEAFVEKYSKELNQ